MDKFQSLALRFEWVKQGWFSGFKTLPDTGMVSGDCRSYAWTVAYLQAGSSFQRFVDLLLFRTTIWFCISTGGQLHVTTRTSRGWVCNIYRGWKTRCPHKRILPLHPLPVIVAGVLQYIAPWS